MTVGSLPVLEARAQCALRRVRFCSHTSLNTLMASDSRLSMSSWLYVCSLNVEILEFETNRIVSARHTQRNFLVGWLEISIIDLRNLLSPNFISGLNHLFILGKSNGKASTSSA